MGSPCPGCSTLITSAPKSASRRPANGPAINTPSSRARTPSRGPLIVLTPTLVAPACGLWHRRPDSGARGGDGRSGGDLYRDCSPTRCPDDQQQVELGP